MYAQKVSGKYGYDLNNPFKITLRYDKLDKYSSIKKPHSLFVASMGDLFHDEVPDSYIAQVFSRMILNNQHKYFILTKRPKRMKDFIQKNNWWVWPGFEHIWLGTTTENQARADERIPELMQCESKNLFLSVEPLLGPIDLTKYLNKADDDINPISWVICGGESGEGCRPMDLDWARKIRDDCKIAGVPYFLKQFGGIRNHRDREQAILDGKLYKELPV
jgi:protein gp37